MTDFNIDHLAELVAERVVAKLDQRQQLVDAGTLAALAGVSRDWVYQRRHELGCVPLGTGAKPRLRFDRDLALERISELQGQRKPRARRKPGATSSTPLLPLKADSE